MILFQSALNYNISKDVTGLAKLFLISIPFIYKQDLVGKIYSKLNCWKYTNLFSYNFVYFLYYRTLLEKHGGICI